MLRFEPLGLVQMYSVTTAIIYFGLLAGAEASSDFEHYGTSHGEHHLQMCYSCMSMDKEQTWPYLQHVYVRPLNFTDHCNRPMIPYKMGLVPCSSVCVVITEMRLVSGHFAGYSFTRGCIHSIAKNGFRNTTLRDYHFELRPSCERLPRNAVFYKSNPTIEDQIYFCTCFGDRCNDDRMNRAASNRVITTYSYHINKLSRFGLPYWMNVETWSFVQLVLRSLVFPVTVLCVWSCIQAGHLRLLCS